MKKKEPADSARGMQGKGVLQTVDEYLAGVAEPARGMLMKIRAAIRLATPREATEVISYWMPAFKHKKVLVWYAAFKNHCSFFPTAEVMDEFKEELKGYTVSKGTVQIPLDKAVPVALIKKMVKLRVERSERKGR